MMMMMMMMMAMTMMMMINASIVWGTNMEECMVLIMIVIEMIIARMGTNEIVHYMAIHGPFSKHDDDDNGDYDDDEGHGDEEEEEEEEEE
eukprot:11679265-Karenia_brevis.AAC.1